MDIRNTRINTAGAYVCLNGLYLFTLGIHPHNGNIPIVRLGGHRQERETGWQCVLREVHEKANLHIKPLRPQRTYLSDWDHMEAELQEFQWKHKIELEPAPLLVITYSREDSLHLSLMYLAVAEGIPRPSFEVKGLLLLRQEEIHRLWQAAITLKQYLDWGGKAIITTEFDPSLVLEPFVQLRLLSRIMNGPSQMASQSITKAGI